jgi:hypothetical protein
MAGQKVSLSENGGSQPTSDTHIGASIRPDSSISGKCDLQNPPAYLIEFALSCG